MKEKRLMNVFLLAQLGDIFITKLALSMPEFQELNPMGAETQAILLKLAVTIFMISIYGLSEDKRLMRPIEKSLQISTTIVSLVVISNFLQVAHAVLQS